MSDSGIDFTDWTVVMPTDRPRRMARAIRAIREAHFGRLRAVIVAGNEATAAAAQADGMEAVLNPGTFVMSKAWNLGLKAVKTKYVFLVEDDTRLLTPFGIDELVRLSAELKDQGVVAPALLGSCLGHKVFEARATWELMAIKPQDFTLVAALVPMSVVEKVGLFDESFTGYGYDDNDFALRVDLGGMKVRVYQRVLVDHESYLSAYRENVKKQGIKLGRMAFENRVKFVAKYGRRVMRWGANT